MRVFVILSFSSILFVLSCVPARQFQDEKSRREKCDMELNELKISFDKLKTQLDEVQSDFQSSERNVSILEKDTLRLQNSMRILQNQYDKINSLYQLLLEKNKELLEGNVNETKKITGALLQTQEELQKKEDELKALETELRQKEVELLAQKSNLSSYENTLKQKEQRITELEDILKQQDKAVKDLKEKVSSALLGFENNGLTVEVKNGKVYVSLEESLLFASGSWSVNAKGKDALVKLAKVLETNTDVNILIEGHTDNVPYKGNGQVKDNWDLSVMRATAIVKIITENSKIDPKRLIAAGRSEYIPIDNANTATARQKNRRTEIILTPKLDELFKILEIK